MKDRMTTSTVSASTLAKQKGADLNRRLSTSDAPRIYLAGPTVFNLKHAEIFAHLKALCEKYGMQGFSPFDKEVQADPGTSKRELGKRIYQNNVELIQSCDAVIADVTSFRGLEPDSGTCFEIGMAVALGKPTVCYSEELQSTLLERVVTHAGCRNEEGALVDKMYGQIVEDFDMPLNLMLAGSCHCTDTAEAAIAHLSIVFRNAN